jgi:carbon storage regulator CsrA
MPSLILKRFVNQAIVIGDTTVTVTVSEINGKSVRLRISAPADVKILRAELLRPAPAKPETEPQRA